MGERIIKQNPSVTVPTDKTLSEVIDLTGADDGKLTMTDTEKVWMICCGFRLTMKEQQNILNGGCLTDRIINAACAILRKQFPGYGGLESTLLHQCTRGLANTTNAMQIIHLPVKSHWAVISTIGCERNSLRYYDSIFNSVSVEADNIIASLLKPSGSLDVQVMNVILQKGTTDCGVYSVAYCTCLALDIDPCLCVFRQLEMRMHLVSCLEKEQFTSFPVLRSRRLTSKTRDTHCLSVCPVCLKPDNGNFMVLCDTCNEWYHNECVDPFNEDSDWICNRCDSYEC